MYKEIIKLKANIKTRWTNPTLEIETKKGKTQINISKEINFENNQNAIQLSSNNQSIINTTRTSIENSIKGLTTGYIERLDLIGLGYKANIQKNILIIKAGKAHNAYFRLDEKKIKCKTYKNKTIYFLSTEKNYLKNTIQAIQLIKKPEVYKGKGIHKQNQIVQLKEGKKK